MTKDYAKRRSPSKKTNKRAPKKTNPSSSRGTRAAKKPMSPVLVFLGGMLITFLVLVLWMLIKKPDLLKEMLPEKKEQTAQAESATQAQPTTSNSSQANSSQSNEPEYTYHEALTTKQVEVDAKPNSTVTSNKTYVMQCGAFKKQEDAETMEAELAFIGMQASVSEKDGWYRVRLGPYSTKRAAESAKHKMQDNNYQDCRIW
ncbi:MAG: SPOR domain-containing protein [Kangiellaceae bacterium]|nr:SPOR domain-containing protein [Kangiellaceae bacterium]